VAEIENGITIRFLLNLLLVALEASPSPFMNLDNTTRTIMIIDRRTIYTISVRNRIVIPSLYNIDPYPTISKDICKVSRNIAKDSIMQKATVL
jgi:hypothetical protein